MKKISSVLLTGLLVLSMAGQTFAATENEEPAVQNEENAVEAADSAAAENEEDAVDADDAAEENAADESDTAENDAAENDASLLEDTSAGEEVIEGEESEQISSVIDLDLMQEGGLPSEESRVTETVSEEGVTFEECVTAAIENREQTIDISEYELTAEEASAAISEVINNNPRYFFLSGEDVPVLLDAETGAVNEVELVYIMDEDEISYCEAVIDDELEEIRAFVDQAPEGELDQVLAIYEYFCLNFCYDNDLAIFDVPGFFMYRKGVCQSYAMAFRLVAEELGIESGYASGYRGEGQDGHAWNAVMVDGKWYMIDLTWDGTSAMAGYVKYDNFLYSQANFGHTQYPYNLSYIGYTDGSAEDTTYEEYWWNDIQAYNAAYPLNGYWYFMSGTTIYRTDTAYSTENAEVVFEDTDEITVGKAMTVYDGKLYFAGKGLEDSKCNNIYFVNPDGTEPTQIELEETSEIKTMGELSGNFYYGLYLYAGGSNYMSFNKMVDLSEGQALYVTGVTVTPSEVVMTEDTVQLTAEVLPETAADKRVYWTSSDKRVAMVDDNGLVTAVGCGTAVITAVTRNGAYSASANITVPESTDIGKCKFYVSETSGKKASLIWTPAENASAYYVYQYIEDDNTQTGASYNDYILLGTTEENSMEIQRSDADEELTYCLVCANEAGRTKAYYVSGERNPFVTWKAGRTAAQDVECEQTASFSLSVSGAKPLSTRSVTLTFTASEYADSYIIHRVTMDEDGNLLPGTEAAYSASTATKRILSVTPGYGYMFFVESIKDGSRVGNMSETVSIFPEGIIFKEDIELGVNNSWTAEVLRIPEDADIDISDLKLLTKDSEIAKVDAETGQLIGVKEGTTTVYVYTADKKYGDICQVNVSYIKAVGVSLNKTKLTLAAGKKKTIKATFTPENASNQNVTWKSSNTSVASVSSAGKITAKKAGTANITVTTEEGGYTAVCKVTVTQPVTGVTLNKTKLSLNVGKTYTLKATVLPTDATNQNVTWKSSKTSVATVTSAGKVRAKAAGVAYISVTTEDGSYVKKCKVTVTQPVTGVTLNKTKLTLAAGKTYKLKATISPSDATNQNVTWKSSKTSVATVTSSGKVTAKKAGTAYISVTTEDGSFVKKCKVTVTQPVTGIKLNKSKLTLVKGKKYTLKATIYPSNATNQNVTWKSSKTSVATVTSSGKITAKKAGTTYITATTEDGSYVAKCKVTVTAG